ncbi:unnamed protein product [Orchesella dallaii]
MQPGGVPSGVPSSHPNMPTAAQNAGMGPNSYMGSLPAHAQRDERVQRQYVKLRRKLDQKQQSRDVNSYNSPYNHNGPVRKDANYVNTNRRNISNGTSKPTTNGGAEEDGSVGSTGSVTSTGTQDEEEENRMLAQTEMLSALIPPTVSDVTSRSAFVEWNHPDRFSETGENKYPDVDVSDSDFRYEVFISDRSRDNRFKSIFTGSALSCRVKDLKPGTMYAIQYCAMVGDVKGQPSTPANFNTLPAEPDPPLSPKVVSRSRSSIQLKWNQPLNDNGSKIINYVLEYDEGKGGNHFIEYYRGKNKQSTIVKLQPAYSYQFRVAAVNLVGQSRYTPIITAMTAGSPPTQPAPPFLAEAGVKYLRLEWVSRATDDEYALQMEDPSTGHGFLAVYNGSAPQSICIDLKRNTKYKFRLKAQNEEGHSKWSEEVVLSTLPDRPGPPHKPTLKGRVHAYGFKVRWEPPTDNGGLPITDFALQIDKGNGFEEIFRGSETEFNIDRLSPGQSYALRVIASGPGGESEPSEPCVITTEPVCPGKCHIPRIVGKPKSNSVHLKWNPPDWDGGSPINQYEVGCTTPDNQTQEAYRGKETDCFVNRLLPGRAYLFQVRAYNRIGAGPWSDPLEIVSGAGSPDAPAAPKVTTKTAHVALVSWNEPLNNGSAVTEYRVQLATPSTSISVEENKEEGEIKSVENEAQSISSFNLVYTGSSTSCEVKGLQPASVHLFRVQAINSAGFSEWSPVASHQMPPSSPNAVGSVEALSTSNSVILNWKAPLCNGSPIIHYNVIVGETIHVVSAESFELDNLMPDSHFKIRIQAVNNVGPGALSSSVKVATKPLPPPAPKLECVSVAHFWMKLKWSDAASKNVEYLVQMINPYKDEFEVVYRGTSTSTKVTRLTEDTEYQFRICAINGAGQGPFSDLYKFGTSKAPPPQVKGVKVEFTKDSNSFRVEWFGVQCNDTLEYQVQICRRRDQDYRTIYRGSERSAEMKPQDLDDGASDYLCRVCAIRICDDRTQLIGPYSVPFTFHAPDSVLNDFASSKVHSSTSSKSLSTTAQVSFTFFQVLEEKMNEISYESRVGILAVFALIILAFVISLITHHVVS